MNTIRFGIRLDVDGDQGTNKMQQFGQVTASARGELDGAASAANASAGAIGKLSGAIGSYVAAAAGAFGAGKLIEMADGWGQLASRIDIASDSAAAAAAATERLMEVSNRTYKDYANSAELYIRTSDSLRELGYSADGALGMVEALQYGLTVSSANAERSSRVIDAWSKSILNGKMGIEEFQTVVSAAPRLQKALADSLDITNAELQQMVRDGKVTTDVLVGVASQVKLLGEEADRMPVTLTDSFQRFENQLTRFSGEAENNVGVIRAMTSTVTLLGDNIESVVALAGVAAVTAFGRYGGALATKTAGQIADAMATQRSLAAEVAYQQGVAQSAARQAQAALGSAELAAARTAEATATAAATAAQARMISGAGLAGTAISALGGPIGLLITALGVAAIAWTTFGDKTDEATVKAEANFKRIADIKERLDREGKYGKGDEGALREGNAYLQSQVDFNNSLIGSPDALENPMLPAIVKQRDQYLAKIAENNEYLKKLENSGLDDRQHANARYATYVADRRSLSEQLEADLETERHAFDGAVRGLEKGSAEYARALDAHNRKTHELRDAAAKKAASATKEQRDDFADLMTEQAGLTRDFAKDWATLTKAFDTGKLGSGAQAIERLTAAQAKLLEQQPAMKSAAEERKKADDAAKKAATDRAQALQSLVSAEGQRAAALAESNARTREDIATLGMTEQQLISYTTAKLDAAAAADEQAAAELDAAAALLEQQSVLPEVAEAYRRLAVEKRAAARAGYEASGLEAERGSARAAEAAAQGWERTSEHIKGAIYDALISSGEKGGEVLKRTINALVFEPTIRFASQAGANIVGSVLNMGADALGLGGLFGGGKGGGSGGIVDIASNLYSAYNNAGKAFDTLSSAYGWLTGTGATNMAGFMTSTGYGATASTLGSGTYGLSSMYSIGMDLSAPTLTSALSTQAASGAGASSTGMMAAAPYLAFAAPIVAWIAAMISNASKPDPRATYYMAASGGENDTPGAWEDGIYAEGAFGKIGMHSWSKDIKATKYYEQFQALAAQDNFIAQYLSGDEVESVKARMDGWASSNEDRRDQGGALNSRMLAIAEGISGEAGDDIKAWYQQAKGDVVLEFVKKNIGGLRSENETLGGNTELKNAIDEMVAGGDASKFDAFVGGYRDALPEWMFQGSADADNRAYRDRQFSDGLGDANVDSAKFFEYIADRIRVDDLQDVLGKLGQSIGAQGAMDWMSASKTTIKGEDGKEIDVDGFTAITTALGQVQAMLYSTPIDAVSDQWEAFNRLFAAHGQETVPNSIAAYQKMIEAVDLNTAAGRELYMTLAGLAPAVGEMQAALLGLAGTTREDLATILRDGLTGKATADAVSQNLQTAVVDGIQSAMATDTAAKITDLMVGGIVTPAIEALLLGGTLAEALSAEHIATVVAQIQAQAAALGAIMSAPEIQGAFAQLRAAMGSISSAVAGVNEAAAAAAEAGSVLANLRAAIVDSFETQLAESQRLAEQFSSIADRLEETARSLRTSAASPLSPEEKYREARRQFEDVSRRARLGDVDALEQLDDVSKTFLDLSREYYASTSAYAADFASVEAALGLGAETARRQESIASAQASYAKAQLDALGEIKSGIDQLTAALLEVVRSSSASGSAEDMLAAAEKVARAQHDWEYYLGDSFAVGRTQADWAGGTLTKTSDGQYTYSRAGEADYNFSFDEGWIEVGKANRHIAEFFHDSYGVTVDAASDALSTISSRARDAAQRIRDDASSFSLGPNSSGQAAASASSSGASSTAGWNLPAGATDAYAFNADASDPLGLRGGAKGYYKDADGRWTPYFADGGMHFGGVRLVGERGPELEVTGPARYFSAEQTAAWFRPSGNAQDSESAALLREVVVELRAIVRQSGVVGEATLNRLDSLGQRLDDVSSEIRRAA